jgi:hypothetical protein
MPILFMFKRCSYRGFLSVVGAGLIWASVAGTTVFAQGISFGVVGGLELNSDFHYRADTTQFFTLDNIPRTATSAFERTRFSPKFGMKIEYEFTSRWSLETGVLVHRSVFTSTYTLDPPYKYPNGLVTSGEVMRYNEAVWEVPLLAKRYFAIGHRALILEGGPSFRPLGGLDGPGRFGITGGIGTMWHAGPLRLQPSLRYTRWSDIRQSSGLATQFRRDEISFLLSADASGATLRGSSGRQPLSGGFIGGTTLTRGFPAKNGFDGLTSRLAGVALDYRFNDRWSAEADVLYHPLVLSEEMRATVVTWEIPVIAKYRFGSGATRPLVIAGPAFRAAGNRNSTNPSTFGVIAGVGWEIPVGRLRFEPTLRYARWRTDQPDEFAPASTRRDQVEMVLAIRYGR